MARKESERGPDEAIASNKDMVRRTRYPLDHDVRMGRIQGSEHALCDSGVSIFPCLYSYSRF